MGGWADISSFWTSSRRLAKVMRCWTASSERWVSSATRRAFSSSSANLAVRRPTYRKQRTSKCANTHPLLPPDVPPTVAPRCPTHCCPQILCQHPPTVAPRCNIHCILGHFGSSSALPNGLHYFHCGLRDYLYSVTNTRSGTACSIS